MSIRRLPETLVNRIAAGEVVERPASALKELVENSIDAGAGRIAVSLGAGGTGRIEVADDGCGLSRADMTLALERHATSKLPGDEIESVATLGFRGEALPSIASVARVTLESRVRGADGWSLVVDNGRLEATAPAALPPGTRVRVEQLFARVPARRKFLRSERSEYAACLDVVKRLAMARPDIGFTLEHDGRRTLAVQPGEDRPARVAALTDRALHDSSVAVDYERGPARLGGVAGLPTFNRGVADHQFLFVNGRPVKDRLLIGAVRAAYQDLLARDRHPVVALFVDLPGEEVDVNVHPAKTEVRFRDPAGIRGLIVGGLRHALDSAGFRSVRRAAADVPWQTSPSPQGGEGGGEGARPLQYGLQPQRFPSYVGTPSPYPSPPRGEGRVGESRAGFEPAARGESAFAPPPEANRFPLGVARGQVAATYIVAEAEDGLILVDQHAAHERLVLERMRRAMAGGGVARQALLLPEVVELDEPACDRLEARAAELTEMGLELERFGPRAMLVRATPALLGAGDVAGLVADLADELAAYDD
ncbi:MAG TPA: DNA mismatch repair endonuclease MutL, partial [Allosphingosinicella sp.]|nr:DNA mismatch repair endonuclease MutL [Allosphingosinicella sp.]